MPNRSWSLATAAALTVIAAACGGSKAAPADSAAAPAAATSSTDTGAMVAHDADPDRAVAGAGLPSGFTAVTDKPDADIANAKYTVQGDRWEVQTGPAHIIYSSKDAASGQYAVSASFEQLAKPRHPEAYGLFFGGSNLQDRAKQRYGYFLVRGTGEYLIKTRDGTQTKPVVEWTASPNVPKEDASGKQTYDLKVHFAPDTAHFLVNGKLVAAVPKSELPTDGVAGLRINHNLQVSVTPVKIER